MSNHFTYGYGYRQGMPTTLASGEPEYDETHVFLLIGQSNMVGRAPNNNSGVYPTGTLQYGQSDKALKPASDPLDSWDEQAGHMNLARKFCIDYVAANPGIRVVLIPRAQGGTGFADNEWNPGDVRYEEAVDDTNTLMSANPSWIFSGIFMHQGESDRLASATYETALYGMIQSMRSDIAMADDNTPFIFGEINANSTSYNVTINNIIKNIPDYFTATAIVNTQDLTLLGDGIHFDATSLDTMGTRYNAALAALSPVITAEAGATRHWLLGAANQQYRDIVGNHILTEASVAPTFSGGLTNILGQGDGLASDVPETATMTACYVVKTDAGTLQTAVIGGTLTPSGVATDGNSLFLSAASGLRVNERGGLGSIAIEASPPLDSYIFVAVSLNTNGSYVLFRGGAANVVISGSGTRNPSTRPYAVGDVHYNAAAFPGALPIAEAIFFMGQAKSSAELNDIYERSKVRMATRNIAIL